MRGFAESANANAALPVLTVTLRDRWLLASFDAPVRACSWAIVGGGIVDARHVAWLEVRDTELRPPVEPRALLAARCRQEGLAGVVGLMTSRSVATYDDVVVSAGGARARCLATVGLGNALRAGDPPGVAGRIGTINLLVHVDTPLSDEALLEASAIATEAKCAVVLGAGIKSRRTSRPATGTGTDCTVVTAVRPTPGRGGAPYAGKHTAVGSLVGAAVEEAIERGVQRWLAENAR
jgi:adenosylcobinamide amidohydrolase